MRIYPAPEGGQSRARAKPLVIRTPGVSPDQPNAGDGACECRIEGTVEVRSDEPLKKRERVAVSLTWYPALSDTVELFMGSPRHFELPPAPCGPQRLRVAALSGGRFTIVSREAMAGFRCERGSRHQMRIVLEPH